MASFSLNSGTKSFDFGTPVKQGSLVESKVPVGGGDGKVVKVEKIGGGRCDDGSGV
jgi:hypothetical protein